MSKIRLLTTMVLLASTISVAFGVKPVQASSNVHFDGLLWTSVISGTGPSIHHTHITIPATSFSSANSFSAGLSSVCKLKGDFDIQVSFKLSVWPSQNGVRVQLYAAGTGVVRFSRSTHDGGGSPGDGYAFDFAGQTPANDLSGKLRMVRSGSTLSGYYFSGSAWILIGSLSGDTADSTFLVSGYSEDTNFANQLVKVTFRDFIITSGTLVCP